MEKKTEQLAISCSICVLAADQTKPYFSSGMTLNIIKYQVYSEKKNWSRIGSHGLKMNLSNDIRHYIRYQC